MFSFQKKGKKSVYLLVVLVQVVAQMLEEILTSCQVHQMTRQDLMVRYCNFFVALCKITVLWSEGEEEEAIWPFTGNLKRYELSLMR